MRRDKGLSVETLEVLFQTLPECKTLAVKAIENIVLRCQLTSETSSLQKLLKPYFYQAPLVLGTKQMRFRALSASSIQLTFDTCSCNLV